MLWYNGSKNTAVIDLVKPTRHYAMRMSSNGRKAAMMETDGEPEMSRQRESIGIELVACE
jgi:hypothetical protein